MGLVNEVIELIERNEMKHERIEILVCDSDLLTTIMWSIREIYGIERENEVETCIPYIRIVEILREIIQTKCRKQVI